MQQEYFHAYELSKIINKSASMIKYWQDQGIFPPHRKVLGKRKYWHLSQLEEIKELAGDKKLRKNKQLAL